MVVKIADKWFERKNMGDGVTFLTEPYVHDFIRCNIWHIRGRDKDLLIDSGLGLVSLKQAEKDLFERHVTAVATHTHFDHVGGMYEQDDIAVHYLEEAAMREAHDEVALTKSALGPEFLQLMTEAGYEFEEEEFLTALPCENFDIDHHKLCPAHPNILLKEGNVVDLGDRHFQVLHLPGHSPGSIGLYEEKTETLFSGDAIYDGPLIANLPESNIEDYINTMKRLKELKISVVHAGHDPCFGKSRLVEIADKYLALWDS